MVTLFASLEFGRRRYDDVPSYWNAVDRESRGAEVAHDVVFCPCVVVVETEQVEVPLDPSTPCTLGKKKVHHVILGETRGVFEMCAHGWYEHSFFRESISILYPFGSSKQDFHFL